MPTTGSSSSSSSSRQGQQRSYGATTTSDSSAHAAGRSQHRRGPASSTTTSASALSGAAMSNTGAGSAQAPAGGSWSRRATERRAPARGLADLHELEADLPSSCPSSDSSCSCLDYDYDDYGDGEEEGPSVSEGQRGRRLQGGSGAKLEPNGNGKGKARDYKEGHRRLHSAKERRASAASASLKAKSSPLSRPTTDHYDDRERAEREQRKKEEAMSKQVGVLKMELMSRAWGKKGLYTIYAGVYLISTLLSLEGNTTPSVEPYFLSFLGNHSMLSSVAIVTNIAFAVGKPPMAKVLDVFGRCEGVALAAALYTIGYLLTAFCRDVKLFVAGRAIAAVGGQGVQLAQQVIVADTSTLANRALLTSTVSLPWLLTTWIGPPLGAKLAALGEPGYRAAYAGFALALPCVVAVLVVTMLKQWHNVIRNARRANKARSARASQPREDPGSPSDRTDRRDVKPQASVVSAPAALHDELADEEQVPAGEGEAVMNEAQGVRASMDEQQVTTGGAQAQESSGALTLKRWWSNDDLLGTSPAGRTRTVGARVASESVADASGLGGYAGYGGYGAGGYAPAALLPRASMEVDDEEAQRRRAFGGETTTDEEDDEDGVDDTEEEEEDRADETSHMLAPPTPASATQRQASRSRSPLRHASSTFAPEANGEGSSPAWLRRRRASSSFSAASGLKRRASSISRLNSSSALHVGSRGFLELAGEVWDNLDVVGMVALTLGCAALLVPLTLAARAPESWANPVIWLTICGGVVVLLFFAFYEVRLSPIPMMPARLLRDRTILAGAALGFWHFLSQFCYESYFTSFLQVARGNSVRDASYISQSYIFAASVAAIMAGAAAKYSQRYKWITIVGVLVHMLGTYLMIHARNLKSTTVELVFSQLIGGIGGGFTTIAAQIGVQSVVAHQDLSISTAIFLTITQIGGAVGGALAGAIWTTLLPARLRLYLPVEDADEIVTKVMASLAYALSFEAGSSTRLAIDRAYADVQHVLNMLALICLFPALLCACLMQDTHLDHEDKSDGGDRVVVLGSRGNAPARLEPALATEHSETSSLLGPVSPSIHHQKTLR